MNPDRYYEIEAMRQSALPTSSGLGVGDAVAMWWANLFSTPPDVEPRKPTGTWGISIMSPSEAFDDLFNPSPDEPRGQFGVQVVSLEQMLDDLGQRDDGKGLNDLGIYVENFREEQRVAVDAAVTAGKIGLGIGAGYLTYQALLLVIAAVGAFVLLKDQWKAATKGQRKAALA